MKRRKKREGEILRDDTGEVCRTREDRRGVLRRQTGKRREARAQGQ